MFLFYTYDINLAIYVKLSISIEISDAPICESLRPVESQETEESEESHEEANELSFDEKSERNDTSRRKNARLLGLSCEVNAIPSGVQFHWTFNSTPLEPANNVPESKFFSEGLISRLSHRLADESDYGSFSCWASNRIGQSKQPCIYHVPQPGQ